MKNPLMLAMAAFVSTAAVAATHVVPSSGEVLDESATFDALSIKGDLTINNSALIKATAAESAVMPDSTGLATITLEGGGNLDLNGASAGSTTSSAPALQVGAGGGDVHIDVSSAKQSGQQAAFYANGIVYSSAATPASEDGVFDLMTLNAGATAEPGLIDAKSKGTTPVRINFNGGLYSTSWRTRVSDNCPIFRLNMNQRVELRSLNAQPIRLFWDYTVNQTFFGGGFAKTLGDGDVILDANYDKDGTGIVMYGNDNWNAITWAHAGDLVLTNKFLLACNADRPNVLPHGANCGDVRLYNTASINFKGNTNVVNSLYAFGSSRIYSSKAGAKLVMGTHDQDATLAATIGANLEVEKFGTRLLSVSNTVSEGGLAVYGGDVRFYDSSFGGALTLPAGSTLEVGDNTEWNVFKRLSEGTFSGAGTLRKVGTNVRQLSAKAGVPKRVEVTGGRLQFAGAATKYEWFKFIFKKTSGGMPLELGRLGLVDVNGNEQVIGKGFQDNCGISDSAMNPGSYKILCLSDRFEECEPRMYEVCTKEEGPSDGHGKGNYAFDLKYLVGNGNAPTYSALLTRETPVPDDENTWTTITYRLKDANTAIAGYVMHSSWFSKYRPTCWEVQASADGVNFETIDEKTDYTPYTWECRTYDPSGAYLWWNNHAALGWTRGTPVATATFGADEVALSGGGVLDLDAFPAANAAIADLTLDFSTGGTIVNFAPAANGRLNLVNVPDGVRVGRRTAIPLTVKGLVDGANLDSWTISVNGVATALTLAAKSDGTGVCITTPDPTTLILR